VGLGSGLGWRGCGTGLRLPLLNAKRSMFWSGEKAEMKSENVLLSVGVATEAAVIGLALYRNIGRKLPLFLAYCIWALVSDGVGCAMTFSKAGYGLQFYVTESLADSVLQFAVFIELAWSVLRPLRGRLSRNGIWLIAAAILAASGLIWPFADIAGLASPSRAWRLMIQLQQTVSILRILFFIVLAGCSQLLALGWRDRELQVATGFGFYSLVSVAVAMVNAHLATARQFSELSELVSVGFLVSMLYWVFSFARADVKRREFSPHMQEILLSLAKAAKVAREELPGSWVVRRERQKQIS
jgi:hypothetical protein